MTAAGLPRGPPPPPPPGTTHRPRRRHLWTSRHHPHAAGTTSHQRPATTAPIALRRVAPWDGCQVSGSTADSPDRKTARAEVAASVTPGLPPRQPEVAPIMADTNSPWTAAKRREAYIAVEIAATRREAAERTFAHYLRLALSHGLTVAEVCRAGDLDEAEVLRLTDPSVAA